ncbi:MAG: ABC transporter ATP-binding protein [Deltaproteobacteria bacterium]|nr:ABC transporter ATP-binding protein [Deltaproteobacteria bacterium]
MLQLKNITKVFSSFTAVNNITLHVNTGEIFGFLGPNGAGKSTSINMICGLLKPTEGEILICGGKDPSNSETRKAIGYVPQSLAIYNELTALENLRFFGRINGVPQKLLKSRISKALSMTGLERKKNQPAGKFSGGMKRRLNIGCALLHDPELIILDEPTVGVDPQSRNRIFENIQELNKEGKTIIYTTHYMEEAQKLCKNVVIIDAGEIIALDSVSNLIHNRLDKTVIEAVIGNQTISIKTDDPVKELEKLQKNNKFKSFQIREKTLEDVFLDLTGKKIRD